MNKKSFLIDLNNLSDSLLTYLLKKKMLLNEREVLTKTEKIQRIEENFTKTDIEEDNQLAQYLYAGRGSLEIFKIVECQIDSNFSHFVHKLLKKKLGEKDYKTAIDSALYPEEGENPRINKIRTLNEEKILIQFTLVDRTTTRYTGYEIRRFPEIKVINCMIDPNKRKVQIRTDVQNTRKCFTFFEELFSPCALLKVSFGKDQIENLRNTLGWKTTEYKGRNMDPKSVISYKTLRKNTANQAEMVSAPEFISEIQNYEMVTALYDVILGDEHYLVQFGITRSSIYFRSFATEEVIDFIANQV